MNGSYLLPCLKTKIQVPASHGWKPNEKASSKDLQDMIRQQQKKLIQGFLLAWLYDIQDLQSNIKSEFIEVREKIEFVSDSLCDTAKTIKTNKERNAISIFNIMSYINLIK